MLNAIKMKKIQGSLAILLIVLLLGACKGDPQERLLGKIEDHQDELNSVMDEHADNDQLARETAALFEQYITEYPGDTSRVPEFYYEATRLYTLGGDYDKAIPLADTFRVKYPDHPLAPIILHLKGYLIYETGMHDLEKARDTYLTFIETYPEHPLVQDVLFSLEHLGQTNEELMEEIKRKNRSHGDQDSTSND